MADTKVSEIIVYGTDPCPRSTDDEIVVARSELAEMHRKEIIFAVRHGEGNQ